MCRIAALIAMACGLTILTRAWNFRDSFRVKNLAVRDDMDTFFLKDLLLLENFRIFIFRQGGRVPT